MRSIWVLFAIAAWCVVPRESQAFAKCDTLFAGPDELETFILRNGVGDAPMRYHELARSIRIETEDASGRLIPLAKLDSEQRPVVVYTSAFPQALCKMVLATYMAIQGKEWQPMAEAARDAAACIDTNQMQATCLADYAAALERRYRAAFDAMPSGQGTAYAIAHDALAQVAKHEYAHHLLEHRQRIRSGALKRIDAEFEADFYALQSGAESGQAVSAMYYFFEPMADMESHSTTAKSGHYESSKCRATNVEDIIGLFGMTPMYVLDAVGGRGSALQHPDYDLAQVAAQLLSAPPPMPSSDSCGRLAATVLREAHGELGRLTALIADYDETLEPLPGHANTGEGIGLTSPETFELIERLQDSARTFTHLKGLAARALSLVIQRADYGGLTPAVTQSVDSVLNTSSDDIMSGDFGRLLQVKGISSLYGEPNRPLEERMNEAQPIFEAALTHLPTSSEAWMSLALIALARGNCDGAVRLADESARYADGPARDDAKAFRDTVQRISHDGECAQSAADFAATFAQ